MDRILQNYLEAEYQKGNFLGNIDEIISILDDIKKKYLYSSDFHGLYHSQKVCFFAYLIGKYEKLSDDDMKILLDAAKYHDIGRESDYEEDLHGLVSARNIDNVISYDNPLDTYYLKAIIEAHSHDDKDDVKVFSNWLYEEHSDNQMFHRELEDIDFERFSRLSDILKDADALDRLRFKNCPAFLDDNYLRREYSKKLINLSKTINEHYHSVYVDVQYSKLKEKYDTDQVCVFPCYHSVGFDFFKAISILKNGVLSHYNATKNHIYVSRNFNGNNADYWISVIDMDISKQGNKEAYDKYVKNGISFICYVNELVSGVSRAKDNGSLEPRISEEYHDEKFVFDKISPENIEYLSIPKHLINESIKNLEYLYCNSQYETICARVNNYLDEIEDYCNIRINRTEFDKVLETLKTEQLKFNSLERGVAISKINDYFAGINKVKNHLNEMIQNWMQIGFAELLNKNFDDNITLKEVVEYVLQNSGVSCVNATVDIDSYHDVNTSCLLSIASDSPHLYKLSTFKLRKPDYQRRRES